MEISLKPDENGETDRVLNRARAIIEKREFYAQLVAGYAAEGLLDTKNDSWLESNQSPLSAEEFKTHIKLKSITVYSQGHANFWYDDGNMFRGHSIQVSIDANDRCTLTDTPG